MSTEILQGKIMNYYLIYDACTWFANIVPHVRFACLSSEIREVGVIPSILFAAPWKGVVSCQIWARLRRKHTIVVGRMRYSLSMTSPLRPATVEYSNLGSRSKDSSSANALMSAACRARWASYCPGQSRKESESKRGKGKLQTINIDAAKYSWLNTR